MTDQGSLTLENTTVANGSSGRWFNGGGIYSSGRLTVRNSTVTGNYGGGIDSKGYFDLFDTQVVDNTRFGVSASASERLSAIISNSTIARNSGTGLSAVAPYGELDLIVIDSTIAENTGRGVTDGTGIELVRTTISENWGVGLSQNQYSTVLTNSTVSGNQRGGIYISTGTWPYRSKVFLYGSTVVGNSGGGIYAADPFGPCYSDESPRLEPPPSDDAPHDGPARIGGCYEPGRAYLEGTIVGGNDPANCTGKGEFLDWDNNLDDDGSCHTDFGFLTGFDPELAHNGGPTETHALLPGSSAIDAGGDCGRPVDQRGYVRDASCDSGAFEFGAIPLTLDFTGSCPGQVAIEVSGATPNGTVALLWSEGEGLTVIPSETCNGLELGLDDAQLLVLQDVDEQGNRSANPEAPPVACSNFMQIVDLTSCQTSSVVQFP